jgi:iron-sulfur cluster insertion protein
MTVHITSQAKSRIEDILAQESAPSFFRICINSGGCSGFQYSFSIDCKKNHDDHVFENVVIDELSLSFIDNATLDFCESLGSSSFSLSNPNATLSCGCGNSFSI